MNVYVFLILEIHLGRPTPSDEDLETLSKGLTEGTTGEQNMKPLLKPLANSYSKIYREQKIKDFWGLRDYYSLVKYLCRTKKVNANDLSLAVGRNFSGRTEAFYLENLKIFTANASFQETTQIPSLDLIKFNLEDKRARHLMVMQLFCLIVRSLQEMMLHYQCYFIMILFHMIMQLFFMDLTTPMIQHT